MPARKILCVSFDRMVSDNRRILLKEAGYDVTATTNVTEALDLLNRERFDVVIVGHRFLEEEKYVLAVEAVEQSNARVLLVCGADADSQIPATSRVYALEGGAGLLSALSALFPVEVGTRSQTAA
jgi:DNA-binding response OmpR family regulator